MRKSRNISMKVSSHALCQSLRWVSKGKPCLNHFLTNPVFLGEWQKFDFFITQVVFFPSYGRPFQSPDAYYDVRLMSKKTKTLLNGRRFLIVTHAWLMLSSFSHLPQNTPIIFYDFMLIYEQFLSCNVTTFFSCSVSTVFSNVAPYTPSETCMCVKR